MFTIVPNVLRDVINNKLDRAFIDCPEAEKDRDILYNQLLQYFDEHGEVPDFKIIKRREKGSGGASDFCKPKKSLTEDIRGRGVGDLPWASWESFPPGGSKR